MRHLVTIILFALLSAGTASGEGLHFQLPLKPRALVMYQDDVPILERNHVSIGPMTRDITVPNGRTLPGFEQRICLTSGVMINQLFFSIVMSTVEEIMWRSGGTEHMHRMNTCWRERGY